MYMLFLSCAAIAGAIFTIQFVLLLLGFGFDEVAAFGGDAIEAGDVLDTETGMVDHGSTGLFSILSIRTVVAGVTMFGLVGMATMTSMEQSPIANMVALLFAVMGGAAALLGVHFLMQSLHKLGADGTLKPKNAIGQTGTVYLPIPAHGDGNGKVQIRVQGRMVEMLAATEAATTLPTGSKVRVVGLVAGSTVQVEPLGTPQKPGQPIAS